MSEQITRGGLSFRVEWNDKGNPPGKVCDVEIHFGGRVECPACEGEGTQAITLASGDHRIEPCACCNGAGILDHPFSGLKLIGFSVWERRAGGGRNVTFPARQYSVNGERRSFALLRPMVDATAGDRIRDLILEAVAELEERRVIAS